VREKIRSRAMAVVVVAGLVSLATILSGGTSLSAPAGAKSKKEKVVYVCSCLRTKSCSCMTEAKTGGPCACGTAGGPPMKAVPADSDWAKENREALAN